MVAIRGQRHLCAEGAGKPIGGRMGGREWRHIRVDEEHDERAKKLAEEDGKSKAELVASLIEEEERRRAEKNESPKQ